MGRKESNPHLTESESVVLPLDHSPVGTLILARFLHGFKPGFPVWRYAGKVLNEARMADGLKLAYFMVVREGASFLGGLLLTDESGIPLDFRYTEPITPTKLQSVLYGKALESHLREEVIQKALLKELKGSPDLFILPASDLAGGGMRRCDVPRLPSRRARRLLWRGWERSSAPHPGSCCSRWSKEHLRCGPSSLQVWIWLPRIRRRPS